MRDPNRLESYPLAWPGYDFPFDDAIATVCAALGRAPRYTDEQGYQWTVTAAAVSGGRLAWVEHKTKWEGNWEDVDYHLHVTLDGRQVLRWEVETYNPHFGADFHYLAWHGEHLVGVYTEKHTTYAVSHRVGGPGTERSRVNLDHAWLVTPVWLTHLEQVGWQPTGRVVRLQMPGLIERSILTAAEAEEQDLTPREW